MKALRIALVLLAALSLSGCDLVTSAVLQATGTALVQVW